MLRYAKSDSDLRIVLTGEFILHSPNTQQHDNNLVTPPKKTRRLVKLTNNKNKQTHSKHTLTVAVRWQCSALSPAELIANQRIIERVERWDVERAAKETAATQECVRGLVLLN